MPPFTSGSRAVFSLISCLNGIRNSVRLAGNNGRCSRFHQFRRFVSVSGIDRCSSYRLIDPCKYENVSLGRLCGGSIFQKRRFLGCGDGEEDGNLSKIYEERCLMGYSPQQLFDVVAAVDLYHGFVPWCQRSEILKQYPDGSFDAELVIGFKFLVENYISHVELKRPNSIKTTARNTGLFDHLINIWQFNPGPIPGTCDLYFLVDFKFNSPLYRQVASMFFKEVASKLVSSFSERCQLVYGPGIRIHENTYEQRV